MRYTFLFLLLTVLTASASAQWYRGSKKVRGNGEVITQDRQTPAFDGVATCCNINVEIKKGPQAVRVEAESNLQDLLETEVAGGRLEIHFRDNANVSTTEQITVYLTVPTVDYLGASSSASIVALADFQGDVLETEASSAGSVKAIFSGNRVRSEASSGGEIVLSGTADQVRAEASSGGSVNTMKLTAKRVRADASSGGGVRVHASEALRADASSAGKVRYVGNPHVDVDTSSGGSVKGTN